jgi:hypothetical protein
MCFDPPTMNARVETRPGETMSDSVMKFASALAALAIASAAFSVTATAMTTGQTARGGPFVSGGIGESEIVALDAQRDRYSLWVITAAKVSGAYLADVRVRITDEKKALVLEHTMAGPWMLVDLPLGRFTVEASYGDQTFTRATTIHAGDRHQMVFHFDVAADVLPKSPEAVKK